MCDYCMLNITYKDRKTNVWVGERTQVRYNQQCEKNEMVPAAYASRPGQGTSTASKTTGGPQVSPLGDHMARKDDKEDQPSREETTWTNTGATRSGRGQHKPG